MTKISLTAATALLLAQAGLAQPALYQNNTLYIPAAVVVGEDNEVNLFRDVEMDVNNEGRFELTVAEAADLTVDVSSIEVLNSPFSDHTNVVVEGFLSSTCNRLGESVHVVRDNEVIILLDEVRALPDEECIEDLPTFDTFRRDITIPDEEIGDGTFTVNVNGHVETGFSRNEKRSLP